MQEQNRIMLLKLIQWFDSLVKGVETFSLDPVSLLAKIAKEDLEEMLLLTDGFKVPELRTVLRAEIALREGSIKGWNYAGVSERKIVFLIDCEREELAKEISGDSDGKVTVLN